VQAVFSVVNGSERGQGGSYGYYDDYIGCYIGCKYLHIIFLLSSGVGKCRGKCRENQEVNRYL